MSAERTLAYFLMVFAAFLQSSCGETTGAGKEVGSSTSLMNQSAVKTARLESNVRSGAM